MSDFAITWELTRGRFLKALEGLSQDQLNFRVFPETLTAGECALHVFAVESSYISQIANIRLDEFGQRLAKCAADGVVNNNPFPFSPEEITPDLVHRAAEYSLGIVNEPINNPTEAMFKAEMTSVLGPQIDGKGVLARLAYHPGYHQAQIYIIQQSPDYPKS